MPLGLSFRAAARRVGCTHRTIQKAVVSGRIAPLADGSLPPAAVDAWNRGRRPPRGGAHRVPAATFRMAAAPPPADVPDAIWNVAAAIHCGALDLAAIVLRQLPAAIARDIVAEWTRRQRENWAGGGAFEPMSEAEPWPPPPAGGAWQEHELFTEALDEGDWQDAAASAAAWRAERGMPPL